MKKYRLNNIILLPSSWPYANHRYRIKIKYITPERKSNLSNKLEISKFINYNILNY